MIIPVTPETYGVAHSDAHQGNFFLYKNDNSTYTQTVIDWDRTEKCWFLEDLGTVVWSANMQYFHDGLIGTDAYEQEFEQFKTWILEAYEWPTTREELTNACAFRAEYIYTCERSGIDYYGPDNVDPEWIVFT